MNKILCPMVAIAFAGLAFAGDSGLQACRAIPGDQERLACYDALPLESPAAPAAAPAVAGTPAPAAAPAAPAREQFGLEAKVAAEVEEIDSEIDGRMDGWGGGTRFTLTNGQVWQVVDGSVGLYHLDRPKVRIRRGMFGTFFIKIEGANHAPKVKRLK